jgi:transposase
MIDMLKRHKVQVLRHAGHSLDEVAKLAGVGKRSVQRIEKEDPVRSVDAAAERVRRAIGRPSKVEAFRSFVLEELEKESKKPEPQELLTVELFRRAKLKGLKGAKTAFYELVASIRPENAKPIVRFEGLPGEFSQHDFGHVDVKFDDGSKKRIHFFASRLKFSRWAQVTIVADERVESLVRPLVEHFDAWGGVPLLAVFDRPKTVALRWKKDGEVTEWNPVFGAVMLELGVGVEVCWPRRGQEKGAVENLVGWVKGSFFKQRRFLDEQDLRQQLAEWHEEVNSKRPSRATGVIPAERLREEAARLRPLKVAPEDLALRLPVWVGPTGYVLHDTHLYSMPPEAISFSGTLYLHRDQVRIVAGRYEAVHPRLFEPRAKSTLQEHRAQRIATVAGRRAKQYMKREHVLEIGEAAHDYLTEVIHRRPREWDFEIDRLHELLQVHGQDALRGAFQHALTEGTFGAEYIDHYLTGLAVGALPGMRAGRLQ